jgi:hypothetical protein
MHRSEPSHDCKIVFDMEEMTLPNMLSFQEYSLLNYNSLYVRFEVFTAVTMKNAISEMLRHVALVKTDLFIQEQHMA